MTPKTKPQYLNSTPNATINQGIIFDFCLFCDSIIFDSTRWNGLPPEERELQRAEKKEQILKAKTLNASIAQERSQQMAETLFKESLYLFSVGNYSEAMTRCEKAIRHYPHANLYLLRGWISVADDEDEKYTLSCHDLVVFECLKT